MEDPALITKEKLAEYERLKGDEENWARMKNLLNSETWYVIERAVDDFLLIDRGLASAMYKEAFQGRLRAICENAEAIDYLHTLAIKFGPIKH